MVDQRAPFDVMFLIVAGGAFGVLAARDHARGATADRAALQPQRLALLAIVTAIAAWETATWRGFVVLLLAPLGAYKLAATLAEPAWRRVMQRQAARDQVKSK